MNPAWGAGGTEGPGKLGSIRGTVKNGERRQPGAKVTLQGGPLKEPKTADADDKGDFNFTQIPPATYKLSAVDMFGQAKGSVAVTVEPGKPTTKDVSITR
jgi:Carboxypeptidase regulatory-like domain